MEVDRPGLRYSFALLDEVEINHIKTFCSRLVISKTLYWYYRSSMDILRRQFPQVILFDSFMAAAKRLRTWNMLIIFNKQFYDFTLYNNKNIFSSLDMWPSVEGTTAQVSRFPWIILWQPYLNLQQWRHLTLLAWTPWITWWIAGIS